MGQHTAQPQMRGSGPAKTGPRGSDEERRALETSSFQSHSASGGDQASARHEAGPSGPRSAAQQTQKRPRLAASGRQCPEAPQAECGPTEPGQGVQRGGLCSGLEKWNWDWERTSCCRPARQTEDSGVLLSHPSAETARAFSPGVRAQEERS